MKSNYNSRESGYFFFNLAPTFECKYGKMVSETHFESEEYLLEWYYWLIIALVAAILLVFIVAGFIAAKSLYHPKTFTLAETYAKENERSPGLMDDYDTWEKETYSIKSRFGYSLQIYFVPSQKPSKNFAVIAHGYSYTHHGAVKYAQMMRELGYNIVMFDERFHGLTGGSNCSMGFYEKFDLYDIISDTFTRFDNDIYLGTYGESMGGAAVVLEQALDKRIKFVITDCAFSDLSLLLGHLIKSRTGLPKYPIIWIANLFFKLVTKVSIFQVSPKNALRDASVPMLFMHGAEDGFIPPLHSQILYDACQTGKDIYIGQNHAKHTDASRYNPVKYREVLRHFLDEIVKANN